MPTKVFIARSGQEIGAFTADEIPSLLQSGFLQTTDQFRIEGQEDWRRLEEFGQVKEDLSRATPLQKAAARTREAIHDLARRVASGSSILLSSTERATAAVTNRLLEDYLPRLGATIRARAESARRSTSSLLQNDDKMRKLFGAAYDSLPKPIHRFVTEPQFIEFCFKHRERLLGKAETKSP
jgi:hypothetical protein